MKLQGYMKLFPPEYEVLLWFIIQNLDIECVHNCKLLSMTVDSF